MNTDSIPFNLKRFVIGTAIVCAGIPCAQVSAHQSEKQCYLQHRTYPSQRTLTSLITLYVESDGRARTMNYAVLSLKGYIGTDYGYATKANHCGFTRYFYNHDTKTYFTFKKVSPVGEFGEQIHVYTCNPKWDSTHTTWDDGEYTRVVCPERDQSVSVDP